MRMKLRRCLAAAACLLLLFALSACRVRTAPGPPVLSAEGGAGGTAGEAGPAGPEEEAEDAPDPPAEAAGDGGSLTRENPEASRKEYDETAAVEIVPGSARVLHTEGEGPGLGAEAAATEIGVSRVDEAAEKTATRTLPVPESDRKGVSEDAKEADSAAVYYETLLKDRLGSLYECKRLNAYLETSRDHVTVHRSSPEHQLLLEAGVWDVSERLLEENLLVDDGWICRKNPGIIVRLLPRDVLGGSVSSPEAALSAARALLSRPGWSGLEAVRAGRVLLLSEELLLAPSLRTAAALRIAKTAYPELFEDTDPDQALEMLVQEAAGTLPSGIYWIEGGN